mgnify:FL=1
MSKFKNVELEFTTYLPSTSPLVKETVLCGDNGLPLAISTKPGWQLYDYTYNLVLFEERYNILSFVGGNCAMMYAR